MTCLPGSYFGWLACPLLLSWACDTPVRVERRQAGDTTFVTTRITARIDTARLLIDATQVLPPWQSQGVQPRVTTFAIGPQSQVALATDDGKILRIAGGSGAVLRAGAHEVRDLQFQGNGSLLVRDLRGNVFLIEPDEQTGVLQPADSSDGGQSSPSIGELHSAPIQQECSSGPDHHFRSGNQPDIRQRYLPSLQKAVLPSGSVVVGCNARYTFDILAADGRRIRVQQPQQPVAVTVDEHDSFVSAWTLRMRNSTGDPSWSWQGVALPDRKPAYQRILTGSDGRIWVWRAQPSVRVAAPPQWVLVGGPRHLWVEPSQGVFDVFNTDGSYVGPVALRGALHFAPFGAAPAPVIHGDTIWLLQSDSSGAGTIVRAHVRWPRKQQRSDAQS